jgi:HSP20 family protein
MTQAAATQSQAETTPRPLATTLGGQIGRLFREYFPWSLLRKAVSEGAFEVAPDWVSPTQYGPAPIVNVSETAQSFEITAEAPGMDETTVEIRVGSGVLRIRGEKKEEKKEERKQSHVSERRFGRFERSFRIPEAVDADKIEASLTNGVLCVVLPKKVEALETEKTIPLRSV